MTEVAFAIAGIGLFVALCVWFAKMDIRTNSSLTRRELERQQMLRVEERRAKIEKVKRETPEHVKQRIERAAQRAKKTD